MTAVHLATLALPWLGGVSPPIGIAIGVLVAAHAVFALRRTLLATPLSIVRFELGPGRECRLGVRDGSSVAGHIAESTIVSGSLVVAAVRVDGQRGLVRLPIVAGMVEPEPFRMLRVRLRWDRGSPAL